MGSSIYCAKSAGLYIHMNMIQLQLRGIVLQAEE